ncbi:MAG: CRISPR-associated protein Csx3 [Nitrospirota bacterium]
MEEKQTITLDLCAFFSKTAKLSELDSYIQKAKALAGEGNDVVLTGAAPVWLYLKIAHALHGKAWGFGGRQWGTLGSKANIKEKGFAYNL